MGDVISTHLDEGKREMITGKLSLLMTTELVEIEFPTNFSLVSCCLICVECEEGYKTIDLKRYVLPHSPET